MSIEKLTNVFFIRGSGALHIAENSSPDEIRNHWAINIDHIIAIRTQFEACRVSNLVGDPVPIRQITLVTPSKSFDIYFDKNGIENYKVLESFPGLEKFF
jgi:hypothetical protein